MATTEPDYQQLVRFVHWLDEERQRALAQLERLAAQVQTLSSADGVRSQAVAAVADDVRRLRGLEQRVAHVEQAVRDVLEPVAEVRLRVEGLERAVQQQAAMRDVALERLQRQLSELSQMVDGLRLSDLQLTERVAGVADEVRRQQTLLSEYGARLDDLRQMLAGLGGRLALAEEDLRRAAEQLAALTRQMESVTREQDRQRELMQLHQLQSQRRFSDWDDQASAWQRIIAEGQAAVQLARQQMQELAADVSENQALAQRSADGLAAQGETIAALRAQQTTLGHELATLRTDLTSDRELLRNLAGQVGAMPHAFEAVEARMSELAVRVAAQREQQEQDLAALQRLERKIADVEEQHRLALRELRAQVEEVRQAVAALSHQSASLAQRLHQRMAEVRQLEEQHRQRQIAELVQQLQELQGHGQAVKRVDAP